MVAGLVPCVILTFGLFFIPESPRWLVRRVLDRRQTIVLGCSYDASKMPMNLNQQELEIDHEQAKERRQKEFETALKKLRGEEADVSQEADEIQVFVLP